MLLLTESSETTATADHSYNPYRLGRLNPELTRTTENDPHDHSERRRGLRIRQARPVKVYDAGAGRYFGGQTEDISSTGLRIELPAWAPVRPGEVLSIHVGLSRKGESLANRRQMIPARVVWVNRTARRQARLEAGVEFLASIAAHLDAA